MKHTYFDFLLVICSTSFSGCEPPKLETCVYMEQHSRVRKAATSQSFCANHHGGDSFVSSS